MQVRRLHQPAFKQIDGSMLGGLSVSYLTETVHLRLGDYKETTTFILASKMAEAMILELFWLTKWSLVIHCGKNARHVVMGKGPITMEEKQNEPERQKDK